PERGACSIHPQSQGAPLRSGAGSAAVSPLLAADGEGVCALDPAVSGVSSETHPWPLRGGEREGRLASSEGDGAAEVSAFLSHLAVAGNVAASTQNQALSLG